MALKIQIPTQPDRVTSGESTYASPRWSGEILDCSMPMTFDQYSRCSFDCLYCFSFFQRGLKKYNPNSDETQIYTELPPTEVSAHSFKAIFTGAKKTEFAAYVNDRIAFQWGGLSDPFDMFEKKRGLGLELLRFLHEYKYPICFSTKGVWWIDDERYASLFRGNDFWNVKMSIINLDPAKAKLMERGVPTPQARLTGIRKLVELQDNGVHGSGAGVTLRLRPFIIGYSDTREEYIELIHQAAQAGATAVSTEFFCMEGRMTPESKERFDAMSEICGMDLIDFYKRNSPHAAGYMRLNHQVKRPYIDKMEAACKKEEMRFYVSDAHHKDRSCNGSCCGLPESWNYQRGQFTEALLIAKKNGEVSWEDIAVKMPECWKTINIVKANGLNLARGNARDRARFRDFSVYDYMRYIWNTPNHPRSPYKYFYGALYPIRVDEFTKNVVYTFKVL